MNRNYTFKAKCLVGVACLIVLFLTTASPTTSMGAISLSGLIVSQVGLFGSPQASIINAPPGTSVTTDADQSGNFIGTVNFGEMMRTDGPCVVSLSFKSRANTRCHISASVSSYSANNLAYNGKPLTSGNFSISIQFELLPGA